jgi:hypothetical protein
MFCGGTILGVLLPACLFQSKEADQLERFFDTSARESIGLNKKFTKTLQKINVQLTACLRASKELSCGCEDHDRLTESSRLTSDSKD